MRKWRAENREKNRQNDLRCRVYRLARQKYGDDDSNEKQGFVREEIARRLGRRMMLERRESVTSVSHWNSPMKMRHGIRMMSPVHFNGGTPPSTPLLSNTSAILLSPLSDLVELPFYSAPQQKIELPCIPSSTLVNTATTAKPANPWSSPQSTTSSPILPHLSPSQRRTSSSSSSSSSNSSTCSASSMTSRKERRRYSSKNKKSLSVNTSPIPTSSSMLLTPTTPSFISSASTNEEQENITPVGGNEDDFCVLPSMHTFLSYAPSADSTNGQQQQQQQTRCIPSIATKGGIKYVDSNKILDEFVGVVLNYVDNSTTAQ